MSDEPEQPEVEDLIRYDILAQEALRGVVKKVLQEVARTGLPGEHHFYITFDTKFAGVRMSSRMRERYPDEMTIVVQHQYWDLETTDSGFSLGLSFDGIPETMVVPYASIRGFFDPAVQFGLQFETPVEGEQTTAEKEEEASQKPVPKLASVPKLKKVTSKKDADKPTGKKPKADSAASDDAEAAPEKTPEKVPEDTREDSESAQVVSLDAFRKK